MEKCALRLNKEMNIAEDEKIKVGGHRKKRMK